MGPSPLTRGGLGGDGVLSYTLGSIPAHAGRPSKAAARRSCSRVHPRSRGAAPRWRSAVLVVVGPSPLTRGGPLPPCAENRRPGSIPAHAGRPAIFGSSTAETRVHRRSRGAAVERDGRAGRIGGPSPLTRGGPAGRRGDDQTTTVHPRSRGAALRRRGARCRPGGPSPLTRGGPGVACTGRPATGSIPAHAGRPPLAVCGVAHQWVHPRSRGAAVQAIAEDGQKLGPSPLTRGGPGLNRRRLQGRGSIPAHAGRPRAWRGSCRAGWVHPRSRGAAYPTVPKTPCGSGPSPLTRGGLRSPLVPLRRRSPLVPLRRRRSIPAHAGRPPETTPSALSSWVHPAHAGRPPAAAC